MFPKSEAEWHALIAQADAAAAGEGELPDVLQIDTAAFERWCAMVGIVPGLDALRAYAIVRRGPPAGHLPQDPQASRNSS
jgi:hypothetical protein